MEEAQEEKIEMTLEEKKAEVLKWNDFIWKQALKIKSQEPEDTVQDMYAYIFNYLDNYDPNKGAISTWIGSACKTCISMYFRNIKRAGRHATKAYTSPFSDFGPNFIEEYLINNQDANNDEALTDVAITELGITKDELNILINLKPLKIDYNVMSPEKVGLLFFRIKDYYSNHNSTYPTYEQLVMYGLDSSYNYTTDLNLHYSKKAAKALVQIGLLPEKARRKLFFRKP